MRGVKDPAARVVDRRVRVDKDVAIQETIRGSTPEHSRSDGRLLQRSTFRIAGKIELKSGGDSESPWQDTHRGWTYASYIKLR